MTRYVIVGAGAIGGMIGGRLAEAGIATAWVARGEHGRALADRGVTLLTPEGAVHAEAPVWLDPGQADLRADDVLIVATKTQDLAETLPVWADLPVTLPDGSSAPAGEVLPVFLATNGVAAEGLAARWFARVFGVCVWCPAVNLEPGVIVVRMAGTSAVLHASRVPAALATDADRDLLAALRADFAAAHIDVPLPADVMPWKHGKLISNLANVVQAVLGPGVDAADVIEAAAAEGRAVMAAAGVDVVEESVEEAVRAAGPRVAPVPGAEGALGGSTWQSLVKGRPSLESDFLNGEIVALAHGAGTAAPVNAALARVGRRAARSGLRPGDLTPDDLRAEVARG
ncbi:2-dehydropantoate 2-reductase [Propioniciclava coleopterorum]|uniref:2-dehydropantoate 2-reductase n=1 Tax=Propioniciclava coleopterorum TaxID=2714937 RepID=A0A6G7Y8Q6_9ACTN|nr:2-dehydropantoate 2-reductase N-terminal domain-containing protein [Propioniciclava coleopterorum]QIK73160.1 2-dehydropantoate 2-reductase [Propioniciclava coleopterorum]